MAHIIYDEVILRHTVYPTYMLRLHRRTPRSSRNYSALGTRNSARYACWACSPLKINTPLITSARRSEGSARVASIRRAGVGRRLGHVAECWDRYRSGNSIPVNDHRWRRAIKLERITKCAPECAKWTSFPREEGHAGGANGSLPSEARERRRYG